MSIKFDSVEIQDATHLPRFIQHESNAGRSLLTVPITREDGEVLIAEWSDKKIIPLQGTLIGTSQSDLESKIDTFKELFSRPEKNLDIDWNGGTRRYVATCTKHTFTRDHYNTSAVPWTAEFTVLTGAGSDTSTTTAASAVALSTTDAIVTGDFIVTTSFTLSGSKAPKPTITLQIQSANAAMHGIEYTNTDTNERIIITSPLDWSTLTGKQIKIDCENRRVTTNFASSTFVETPFFGVFPTFKIGTNNVQIRTGGIVNQRSSEDTVPYNSSPTLFSMLTTTTYGAVGFVVPYTNDTFGSVILGISHSGTAPVGNFIWYIVGDNGGVPDIFGTVIATSTVAGSAVSTYPTYSYKTSNNSTVFTLKADTRYWLAFRSGSDPVGGTNEYVVNLATGIQYPRGTASSSTDSGTTWFTSSPSMFPFRILFAGQGKATDLLHTVQYTPSYL